MRNAAEVNSEEEEDEEEEEEGDHEDEDDSLFFEEFSGISSIFLTNPTRYPHTKQRKKNTKEFLNSEDSDGENEDD